MGAQRARVLLTGAAALLLCPHAAEAQVSDGIVLNIMRECAKIDDPTARLACYDNNIRSAGASPRTTAQGGAPVVPQGGSAPVASSTPQGFGAESMRSTRRREDEERRTTAGSLRTQVTEIARREPGIYVLTLQDGARWLFAEGVSTSYRLPSRGDTVEIERGALGSFLMRFNDQTPVPVRRIQ